MGPLNGIPWSLPKPAGKARHSKSSVCLVVLQAAKHVQGCVCAHKLRARTEGGRTQRRQPFLFCSWNDALFVVVLESHRALHVHAPGGAALVITRKYAVQNDKKYIYIYTFAGVPSPRSLSPTQPPPPSSPLPPIYTLKKNSSALMTSTLRRSARRASSPPPPAGDGAPPCPAVVGGGPASAAPPPAAPPAASLLIPAPLGGAVVDRGVAALGLLVVRGPHWEARASKAGEGPAPPPRAPSAPPPRAAPADACFCNSGRSRTAGRVAWGVSCRCAPPPCPPTGCASPGTPP